MTRVYKDIPYGTKDRQKLDVYLPGKDPKSTIIFWHGGSWLSGDKATYKTYAKSLTKLGIAVVLPNYRLFPESRWNYILEDGAKAVKWVQENIKDYGVETTNIVLSGHSAGAYIAAMLTLEKSYIGKARVKKSNIKGFIGLAGPYDFYPHPKLRPIFDVKDKLRKWLPISHTKNAGVPVLLLHGRFDKFVEARNSINLANMLEKDENEVELKIYWSLEHLLIIPALLRGFRWLAPIRRDIKRFLLKNELINNK
ncbi:MAG: alpha/beta hydrolase [Patescibacteria group bacterium]